MLICRGPQRENVLRVSVCDSGLLGAQMHSILVREQHTGPCGAAGRDGEGIGAEETTGAKS